MSIAADPMDTTEFKVDHLIRNLCSAVWDLNDLRRSNEGRIELQSDANLMDVELCRDQLSKLIYDMGGDRG